MVTLGIEFLGKGQAVGGAEIDAEGASLADFGPNEDRPFARTLYIAGVTHGTLFQANPDSIPTTSRESSQQKRTAQVEIQAGNHTSR
jgi:hypothetical protein